MLLTWPAIMILLLTSVVNWLCYDVNSKPVDLNTHPSYSACSRTLESVKIWMNSSSITCLTQTLVPATVCCTDVINV